MNREFFINAFTRLALQEVMLGEMQVGNPKQTYPLKDSDRVQTEIDMTVRLMNDAAFVRQIYDSPETGYFEKAGCFYYRNCNVANDMNWPDVFYRGRLPHSLLRIRVESMHPVVRIDVQVTWAYCFESRSRLTRIPTLDQTVNNILLIAAIMRGYLPMHGSAIEATLGPRRSSLLFMGLPNTGKTRTSVDVRRALAGDYLAEDICFARRDGTAILGAPFTLDETKIQNYDELLATKYVGAPLGAIVMLRRVLEEERVRVLPFGSNEVVDFVYDMNRYEFEWNHDPIVRHFLIGGAKVGMSNSGVARRYESGLQELCASVGCLELSGRDPSRWSRLLADRLLQDPGRGPQGLASQ